MQMHQSFARSFPPRISSLGAAFWVGAGDANEFVPNTPLGMEEDVPNPEKPVALCEAPDGTAVPKIEPIVVEDVGCAAVPKIEPVVVEDVGCTAAGEASVAVILGIWAFEGEGFVRNSPLGVAADADTGFPNE